MREKTLRMRDRASTEDLITPCVSLLERLALDQVFTVMTDIHRIAKMIKMVKIRCKMWYITDTVHLQQLLSTYFQNVN